MIFSNYKIEVTIRIILYYTKKTNIPSLIVQKKLTVKVKSKT
jgi:hypothetical protein